MSRDKRNAVTTLAVMAIFGFAQGCGDGRATPPALDATASKLDARTRDAASSHDGGTMGDGAAKLDGLAPPKAGKIILFSDAIKGQKGHGLLAFHDNKSRLCVIITNDLFSLPPTVMTNNSANSNPCGPKTPATIFQPGTYSITVGIYIPGKQVPETSTTIKVTVNGDTTAKVNGAALSAPK